MGEKEEKTGQVEEETITQRRKKGKGKTYDI